MRGAALRVRPGACARAAAPLLSSGMWQWALSTDRLFFPPRAPRARARARERANTSYPPT